MGSLTLIIANLRRKPLRTLLTWLSLVIAFLLFMLLRAISTSFSGGLPADNVARLMLDAKYSMTDNLPMAHIHTVAQMPGVDSISGMVWFGGYYQDPKNKFAKAPVDHQTFFRVNPELIVADDVLQRFRASRRAVVVAESIARQFGWQVGDLIPIRGDIWPREDGSWDWAFEMAGTYRTPPDSRMQPWMLMRYDFFNESVADWVKNQVGWAVLRVTPGTDAKQLALAIDSHFENAADPTRTLSEDEYARQFANQVGNIAAIAGMILAAVFFTILLLTANIAALSFRERVGEMAVMKTLGFKNPYVSALLLAEVLALCLLGAAAGISVSYLLEPTLQQNLRAVVGGLEMSLLDAGRGLALATLIGLCIGLPPAWAAWRLSITDALRETA